MKLYWAAFLLGLNVFSFAYAKDCAPSLGCPEGYIPSSERMRLGKPRCVKIPSPPHFTIQLPFSPKSVIKCAQGNGELNRSHSHDGIAYAVDLLSPPDAKPANIYAAHDGITYTYDKCKFESNYGYSYNMDDCGTGYGNHIRILDKSGYLTIYAHLSKIFIKDRQQIKKGELIGLEGNTEQPGSDIYISEYINLRISKNLLIP